MIYISSGKFRGKKLLSPDENITRPTSAKARASLANIIESQYKGYHLFIDAFAGSGGVGLEILSRGLTSSVLFIEENEQAFKILSRNCKDFSNIKLINSNCFKYLKNISNSILFCDAPFDKSQETIDKLDRNIKNSENSLIIIETDSPLNIPVSFELIKIYKYGRIQFYFLKK